MACCTSQFETVRRFVESRRLPDSTLVRVKSTKENGFTKETYVNCNNEPFEYTRDEFLEKFRNQTIKYKGELSETDFEQLIIGFTESPLISKKFQKLISDLLE